MKRHLPLLAIAAALVIAPFAVAAGEGDPILGGARNPSPNASKALTRETQIIANNGTYGTRQSNKSDSGGGAIYGCRSRAGNEPCVRAVNLADGRAFEFATAGGEGGRIDVGAGGDGTRPFTTNATGVATGLNADRVDGVEPAQLLPRFAQVGDGGQLGAQRGATGASRVGVGLYRVTFADDISRCALSAQQTETGDNAGATLVQRLDPRTVAVRTRNGGGGDGTAPTVNGDHPFDLTVTC